MPHRKNRQKVAHIRQESTFSHHLGRPLPLSSIPEPGFQQFRTSSRPRRYCRRTQLPDSVKDFPKECLRHSYFGHLEHHIPRMPHHLGSDLNQLLTQRSERPFLHRLGQYQTPQKITKVVSQSKELKADLIIYKIMTRKPRPVQGVLRTCK